MESAREEPLETGGDTAGNSQWQAAAPRPAAPSPEPVETAPKVRFHLRTRDGELRVASFAELQQLYHAGFIAAEDEVRREGSERWQKAGEMRELAMVRPRPWLEGNEFALLAALICALSLAMIFLFR